MPEEYIIKNFEHLATSPLRKQALMIAEAGLLAINTKKAVEKNFSFDKKTQKLKILNQKYDLKKYKRVLLAGFGKASLAAASSIKEILGDRVEAGAVIDLKKGDLGKIKSFTGTHPLPTRGNVEASLELVNIVKNLGEDDLVICIVSGGGSALFCLPTQMDVSEECAIFLELTKKGANISELNTVRKHISKVKGGNLAKIIYPASCVSLIFSDVPGDDLSMVASGPTVLDKTSKDDAVRILEKYGVLQSRNMHSCKFFETPKEEKYFAKMRNILFVSANTAMEAMKEKAQDLGFAVKVQDAAFSGEARNLGPEFAQKVAKKNFCLLAFGESTVKIKGKGIGGRNMEMALSALSDLEESQTMVCLASDGRDNTDSAGAIVDGFTKKKAANLKLDPEDYLKNNDSFNFFIKVDDAIITGLTGSNVADLVICLRQ